MDLLPDVLGKNSSQDKSRGEPAQALSGDSPVRVRTGIDMKAMVIENYLKDFRALKIALDYCTLTSACQFALEGRGPPDLQDQAIATIS